jgi:hypothetical protein
MIRPNRVFGMRACTAVVLALVWFLQGQAQAQNDTDELVAALADLQSAVNALPADLSSDNLRGDTARLTSAARSARNLPFNPAEYTRSLRSAAELLKGSPSRTVVEDVTVDLDAKTEHSMRASSATSSSGPPGGTTGTTGAAPPKIGGLVTLTVNTLRNGQPISNLRVQALLKLYEHVQGSEPRTFLRVSSPTQMDLEPGRYWVWALDPSTSQTSQRVLVTVLGSNELVLDLTVP